MIQMRTIYTILLLALSMVCMGQSKKAFLEAAEKATLEKNHYAALTYLNEALEYDEQDADVLFRAARAAQEWDALLQAERKFSYLIDTLNAEDYPDARFYLAQVRQKLGQYEQAQTDFELYLTENSGEDEKLTAIANKELKALEWARSMEDKTDLSFDLNLLEGGINSSYSDFGAIELGDDLFFTSMKYEEEKPDDRPALLFSKILKAENGENPIEWDDNINERNKVIAHSTFANEGSRVYYTICDYVNMTELRCNIYFRDISEDGSFSPATSVGAMINDTMSTATQPNISTHPSTGEQTLYFVSDRDGGKGGLDIWKAKLNSDGTAMTPENLADINTMENEITPFFHDASQTLFFSSRGYMTLGGYDIYKSPYKGSEYETPVNYGMPANSSYDDVYFTINDDESKAYLSSNRNGTQYVDGDNEACCFDIYRADIEEVELILNAMTFDKYTSEALPGTTVYLIDAISGELIAEHTNNKSNEHLLPLKRNKDYLIVGTKDGFYPDTIAFSTRGISSSDTIVKKLFLDSDYYSLSVNSFDSKTREALNGATVKIYDLTDPNAPVLVETNELGNDFFFQLDPEKEYKIVVSKPEYREETLFISTKAADNPGGRNIKKDVYLFKPELDSYLPLSLYFDNDLPDRNSRSTQTSAVYSQLYDNYMTQRDRFKRKYKGGATGEQEIDAFFDNEVQRGHSLLQVTLGVLARELQQGQVIEIQIKGYASPLSEAKYNLVLGQRRVASVRNEIMSYGGGQLKKYLDAGQLIITDISFGEELAKSNVSDSRSNRKLSIYSPEASRERRVEIISVTKK